MSEGVQKRVQPDLVREIEEYSGGSFSEKMVKWRYDVDRLSHSDDLEEKMDAIHDLVKGIETLTKQELDEVVRRYT